MRFLNWPYVQGVSAWGDNTSKYDFCEMDYYISDYIAEFINTFTNLGYAYLGFRGILHTKRQSNDSVIILCYALLSCIGIGSAIYHTAPKYFTQMIDEISMLYATTGILYGALSITLGRAARGFLSVVLLVIIVAVSVAHCYMGNVRAFRLTFLAMLLSVLGQCVWLLSTKVLDAKVLKQARHLALYGTCTFVTGFILWNIDNGFCAELSWFRSIVGMPLGFISELHGWWHILTGLGVYYYIVFIEYLRLHIKSTRQGDAVKSHSTLFWPSRWSLPYLETFWDKERKGA